MKGFRGFRNSISNAPSVHGLLGWMNFLSSRLPGARLLPRNLDFNLYGPASIDHVGISHSIVRASSFNMWSCVVRILGRSKFLFRPSFSHSFFCDAHIYTSLPFDLSDYCPWDCDHSWRKPHPISRLCSLGSTASIDLLIYHGIL